MPDKTTFKIQFTRTITDSPEYEEINATSRENAMAIFYGRNPTFYIIKINNI
jgi:hypothetical protein